MLYCKVKGMSGPCPGHLGKFDDCLAEALWDWSFDDAVESVGDTDYQGHYAAIVVPEATTHTLEHDTPTRVVPVPAGHYIVHTASSGAVSLRTYRSADEMWQEFRAAEKAYWAWFGEDEGEDEEEDADALIAEGERAVDEILDAYDRDGVYVR